MKIVWIGQQDVLVMRISGVFASVPGSNTALVCNHPPVTAALHKPVDDQHWDWLS